MEQDHITRSIGPFYGDWRDRMIKEGVTPEKVPTFGALSAEARIKWMLAFSATIEVGARMGEAIAETLGGLPDGD
jgi:hypothetical protein